MIAHRFLASIVWDVILVTKYCIDALLIFLPFYSGGWNYSKVSIAYGLLQMIEFLGFLSVRKSTNPIECIPLLLPIDSQHLDLLGALVSLTTTFVAIHCVHDIVTDLPFISQSTCLDLEEYLWFVYASRILKRRIIAWCLSCLLATSPLSLVHLVYIHTSSVTFVLRKQLDWFIDSSGTAMRCCGVDLLGRRQNLYIRCFWSLLARASLDELPRIFIISSSMYQIMHGG